MSRILLADLKQETSTFNPAPTPYDMFRIVRGSEILNQFVDTRTELAGVGDVPIVATIDLHAILTDRGK